MTQVEVCGETFMTQGEEGVCWLYGLVKLRYAGRPLITILTLDGVALSEWFFPSQKFVFKLATVQSTVS